MTVDLLALEQLHGMGNRKPGLAGSGRAGREDQRVTLERAHIGILRRGAGAHTALAEIDLLEVLPRRRRVEVEQRTLRQRQADDAVNVALDQFIAALEPFIKAFEHTASLLAGLPRAFQGDVVTPRSRGDAQPPLDQGKVLAVLSEQR